MSDEINDQLIGIGGYSGTGKTASLRNLPNQERWAYLNCEAGKRPPFKNNFNMFRISDPYQVWEGFNHFTENPNDSDGIIIDSATFMMDMFETQYIRGASNTQTAWGDYAHFWKTLMQEKVVRYGKPVIIIAHIRDDLDEKAMEMKTAIPIKGSLKNNGLEAYFSTVVEATKMPLKDLEPYQSDMLKITPQEEALGFKYVFQTQITKNTTGKRIRSPMGLFSVEETYIDNDCKILLDRLHDFYS